VKLLLIVVRACDVVL